MTPMQEKLLVLLREIVALCDEHGIVYFTSGGTTLGAMRHAGFIPWDDDIDIMMPRKDWTRFVELCRHELPPGRALCCLELDDDYPHVFGRYVDTTTTSIHYNQFLGGTPEGIVIDIFILDPVPDAEESYDAHRKILSLYNDLANPLGYSYPLSSDMDELKRYTRRIGREGRRAVLSELSAELGKFAEERCDYLVFRWAATAFLFEKSMFGTGRYEQFEGLRVRVPYRCADYLVQHYGDDWMYIPKHAGRMTHDAITFTDIGYDIVQQDYLQFIDVERTKKAILARRKAHIRDKRLLDELDRRKAAIVASFARSVTIERAGSCDKGMLELLDEGRHDVLDWVFAEFYAWQLNEALEGREQYLSISRYYNPVLVDIGDELLSVAVLNLVDTNRIGKARRLLRIRKRAKGALSEPLEHASDWIELVSLPPSLADLGLDDEALELSRLALRARPANFSNTVFYLGALSERGSGEELEEETARAAERFGEAGELAKFQADCLRMRPAEPGSTQQARDLYAHALAHTTNELIARQARAALEKTGQGIAQSAHALIPSSQTAAVQDYPRIPSRYDIGSLNLKLAALLCELDGICAENGIEYLLGPRSLSLALTAGSNVNGFPTLDLMVFAHDFPKLEHLLESEVQTRAGRALDCWKTNPKHLRFDMDYVDTTTTYIQLDEGWNICAHGIKLNILPICYEGDGLSKQWLDYLEAGWEMNGYALSKHINAKRAANAATARIGMLAGRKRLANYLFESLSKANGQRGPKASICVDGTHRRVFDAGLLGSCTRLSFLGHEFPAPENAEGFLEACCGREWERDALGARPSFENALFSEDSSITDLETAMEQDGASLEGYFALMFKIRIGMIPSANDLRIRNRAMDLALRTRDRKALCDDLDSRSDEISQLEERGDFAGLEAVYAPYEKAARAYLKKDLGLCPSKEHLDRLCALLRRKGEGPLADKLERLAPEEHYAPLPCG